MHHEIAKAAGFLQAIWGSRRENLFRISKRRTAYFGQGDLCHRTRSAFNVLLQASSAQTIQGNYRQQSASGVVLLAHCFHDSRATATRLPTGVWGEYISISKPQSLVRRQKIKRKYFCITRFVLIWHQEQSQLFTKTAFASYIKRFILNITIACITILWVA